LRSALSRYSISKHKTRKARPCIHKVTDESITLTMTGPWGAVRMAILEVWTDCTHLEKLTVT
jgi:hypothetical protein